MANLNDDVSFDSIEGSEDDELDPREANDDSESILSGGDRDNTNLTEDVEDEDSQPGIDPR